jgi:hypothetical protein
MRKIFFAILAIGVFFFGYVTYQSVVALKSARGENLPSVYSLDSQDSIVISSKYRKSLKVNEVVLSKVRNAMSWVELDEKYRVMLYRLRMSDSSSLSDIFYLDQKNTSTTIRVVYRINDYELFEFKYKSGGKEQSANIFATVFGDSLKTEFVNKNVCIINLRADSWSLRYGKESPIDFWADTHVSISERSLLPTELLFIKKGTSCLFAYITPLSKKIDLPHKKCLELIDTAASLR